MFFLPLFFLSHQIVNIFITPFRFLFDRLEWPNGKFHSPSPEGCWVSQKYLWVLLWHSQSCHQQYQLVEKRTEKSINRKRRESQILLPCCEKTKLCLFHHSSRCLFRDGFQKLLGTASAKVINLICLVTAEHWNAENPVPKRHLWRQWGRLFTAYSVLVQTKSLWRDSEIFSLLFRHKIYP